MITTEFEAKFLNIDIAVMQQKLQQSGFTQTKPRTLMTRTTLHRADRTTHNIHEWWRVRNEGDKITMTYKRTVDNNALDGTHEVETIIGDYQAAIAILAATGLQIIAEQETRREIWARDAIEICLDEWPGIKPFIEIEGPNAEAVTNAATELGFDMKTAVFGGVANIYQIELGIAPEDLNTMSAIRFDTPITRYSKTA